MLCTATRLNLTIKSGILPAGWLPAAIIILLLQNKKATPCLSKKIKDAKKTIQKNSRKIELAPFSSIFNYFV